MTTDKGRHNRQRQQVNWIRKRYPNAWDRADALRRDHRHEWPDWCYLPIRHWKDIVRDQLRIREHTIDSVIDAARLAALGAWRVTQGIYRFDPDLYAALIDTPLTGDLPDELLYRLPAWGVYLETPGLSYAGQPMLGFYATLNEYLGGNRDLRLLIDSDIETRLFPVPIRLGQGSIMDSLRAYCHVVRENLKEMNAPERLASVEAMEADLAKEAATLTPMLSLLLYLCAEDADYERTPRRVDTTRPKKLGGKTRVTKIPDNARVWDVGTRIGAAIRKARASVEPDLDPHEPALFQPRNRPRPHWRRAHWHTYWTGKKDGERTATVKWLPPIPVGLDGQELPAVVHPVKPG